jgi:hypothetical protein
MSAMGAMPDWSTTGSTFREDPETALDGYRVRGFHIEPAVVEDEFCDRLIAVASSKPNALGGRFEPIAMPHRQDPLFLDMMKLPAIVVIVERIVGGQASGLGADFSYMQPGTPGWLPHQDNLYIQAPPNRLVSVWTALTDAGPENGGLIFYPNTHELGALPIERLSPVSHAGQSPSASALQVNLPPSIEPLHLRMKKGTSVFFHPLLVHGSNANASNRFRQSFLATYIRQGSPFRPGTMQKRSEVDLYEGR